MPGTNSHGSTRAAHTLRALDHVAWELGLHAAEGDAARDLLDEDLVLAAALSAGDEDGEAEHLGDAVAALAHVLDRHVVDLALLEGRLLRDDGAHAPHDDRLVGAARLALEERRALLPVEVGVGAAALA